jgi:3-oxoacyl-[acyl-carrier-protein] synthase-3
LQKYGNCIAASIPLGLEELYNRNQILKNKDVFILGSGAGLTFGCMALRF